MTRWLRFSSKDSLELNASMFILPERQERYITFLDHKNFCLVTIQSSFNSNTQMSQEGSIMDTKNHLDMEYHAAAALADLSNSNSINGTHANLQRDVAVHPSSCNCYQRGKTLLTARSTFTITFPIKVSRVEWIRTSFKKPTFLLTITYSINSSL